MDRRRAFAAFFLIIATGASRSSGELPIREAHWIAPDRRLTALMWEPAECLTLPESQTEHDAWLIGRTAFRAPLLLGGQAARAGLSCASCHRNGRGNPNFQFPGLSGTAGSADVTSSLMSSHRDNGVFDPKRIPDLALDLPKVSRLPGSDDLRVFIEGLITQEFDGAEPPPRVLEGLAVYVRSMGSAGCEPDAARPVTLSGMIDDAGGASEAALIALKLHDRETARLMIGAARSALGRIDERFSLLGASGSHTRLMKLDQKLADLQARFDAGKGNSDALISAWQSNLRENAPALFRAAPNSLFNPDRLEKALRD